MFKLIKWRLTGYRELSKLLHASYGYNDALTLIGLDRAEVLAREEARLLPIGRNKHWIEKFLF
jgi:hypothetical protein